MGCILAAVLQHQAGQEQQQHMDAQGQQVPDAHPHQVKIWHCWGCVLDVWQLLRIIRPAPPGRDSRDRPAEGVHAPGSPHALVDSSEGLTGHWMKHNA